jgi:hypothetical protein
MRRRSSPIELMPSPPPGRARSGPPTAPGGRSSTACPTSVSVRQRSFCKLDESACSSRDPSEKGASFVLSTVVALADRTRCCASASCASPRCSVSPAPSRSATCGGMGRPSRSTMPSSPTATPRTSWPATVSSSIPVSASRGTRTSCGYSSPRGRWRSESIRLRPRGPSV